MINIRFGYKEGRKSGLIRGEGEIFGLSTRRGSMTTPRGGDWQGRGVEICISMME